MKKIIVLIIFFFTISSVSYAEKFVCSYLWNGEPNSLVLERSGKFFKKSNDAMNKIIFEDSDTLVLSNTFTRSGEYKPTTFSTIIDKEELNFVMVGLAYQESSEIIEGKCEIF